ncbi:holin family protein [Pseudoalteromonas sp. SMS1]|uniref:3TM-type holin n=1 Tax=Pseudoalteromonas sp. SMS1 TaxID=2908894 RepID=UPI001F20611E|nr:3TM-type holin [Pseudoalteromonas sp. SMS1]MCF2856487.1 holin family protein [Pseudoalteromonas sp. SMS1]
MSWFTSLFMGDVREPLNVVGNIIDELYTSEEEVLEQQVLKARLLTKRSEIQAQINSVQASHRSVFVAGARPFLMWVCGFGFLFAFVINPILQWLLPEHGVPELPLDVMLELTLGMLGLAGLRTIEKIKGVAK